MGYNTTVMILNDALESIEKDPDFGKNLAAGVRRVTLGKPVDVFSKNGSAATVIETHHADGTSLVAVGGNDGISLGTFYYVGNPYEDEGKVAILKALAEQLGYRIVKKSAKV